MYYFSGVNISLRELTKKLYEATYSCAINDEPYETKFYIKQPLFDLIVVEWPENHFSLQGRIDQRDYLIEEIIYYITDSIESFLKDAESYEFPDFD